ncbi:hypothetical protein R5R35_009627 [Gryllus longicercus]|uniref:Uncharacterized protein n=1 Tax=Gryllus longicercus TaxID=2509291 RepID=A0AAN9V4L9_9ORTH
MEIPSRLGTDWALLAPLRAGLFVVRSTTAVNASPPRSPSPPQSPPPQPPPPGSERLRRRRRSSMSDLQRPRAYSPSAAEARSPVMSRRSAAGSIGDLMNMMSGSASSVRSDTLVARRVPLTTVTPTRAGSPVSAPGSPPGERDDGVAEPLCVRVRVPSLACSACELRGSWMGARGRSPSPGACGRSPSPGAYSTLSRAHASAHASPCASPLPARRPSSLASSLLDERDAPLEEEEDDMPPPSPLVEAIAERVRKFPVLGSAPGTRLTAVQRTERLSRLIRQQRPLRAVAVVSDPPPPPPRATRRYSNGVERRQHCVCIIFKDMVICHLKRRHATNRGMEWIDDNATFL